MSMSLSEVVARMRKNGAAGPHRVDLSLTVHSQKRMNAELAPYHHSVYFAFGSLHYVPGVNAGPFNRGPSDYLRGDSVKAVSNGTHSQPPTAGGDYQSFLVTEPAMQSWEIRIDPSTRVLGPAGSSGSLSVPRITVTRPGHRSFSVDLTEDQHFSRGVGPDPASPGDKALYSLVFSEASDIL
jgi:hypothetical protein